MSEISDWNIAAGNNNAAPPNGWPENTMTFGQVNDTAREMMAVICRWYRDISGYSTAVTNSANTYTATISRTITAYYVGLQVRWRPTATNTGDAYLSVNGLGHKQIVTPDGAALRSGDLPDFVDVYYHPSDRWMLANLMRRQVGEFAPGTRMIFAMAAAPTGWTQDTSWNDRLMRVVSGSSGGNTGGAWGITGLSTESANHTHLLGITVTGVASVSVSGTTADNPSASAGFQFGGQANAASHPHNHTFSASQTAPVTASGSATTAGVSVSHTHYGDGNWRPAYLDVISCFKSFV